MNDLYRLYFYETGTLVIDSLIREQGWLEKLKNEGVFSGVYARIGDSDYIVGNISTRRYYLTNGYYIDRDGFMHYVYSEDEGRVFLDAIVGMEIIQSYFHYLQRNPSAL